MKVVGEGYFLGEMIERYEEIDKKLLRSRW